MDLGPGIGAGSCASGEAREGGTGATKAGRLLHLIHLSPYIHKARNVSVACARQTIELAKGNVDMSLLTFHFLILYSWTVQEEEVAKAVERQNNQDKARKDRHNVTLR